MNGLVDTEELTLLVGLTGIGDVEGAKSKDDRTDDGDQEEPGEEERKRGHKGHWEDVNGKDRQNKFDDSISWQMANQPQDKGVTHNKPDTTIGIEISNVQ